MQIYLLGLVCILVLWLNFMVLVIHPQQCLMRLHIQYKKCTNKNMILIQFIYLSVCQYCLFWQQTRLTWIYWCVKISYTHRSKFTRISIRCTSLRIIFVTKYSWVTVHVQGLKAVYICFWSCTMCRPLHFQILLS